MYDDKFSDNRWALDKKEEDDEEKKCESNNFARELTMCKKFEKERICVKRGIIND
jgi:hypothetical protein